MNDVYASLLNANITKLLTAINKDIESRDKLTKSVTNLGRKLGDVLHKLEVEDNDEF